MALTRSFHIFFKWSTMFFLPQRVLGMVLTASEVEPTPSASLQEIAKLFRWKFVMIRQIILLEKIGESK